MESGNSGRSLRDVVDAKGLGETIDLEEAFPRAAAFPVTLPDPAHLHLTGTGSRILAPLATRDAMHRRRRKAPRKR